MSRFQIAQAYGSAVQTYTGIGNKAQALASFKRSSDVWEELLREDPRNPQLLAGSGFHFQLRRMDEQHFRRRGRKRPASRQSFGGSRSLISRRVRLLVSSVLCKRLFVRTQISKYLAN